MPIDTEFESIVQTNVPLAPRTWLGLGGPAEYFAEPTSIDELVSLVARCHAEGIATRLMGGGSNLLVREQGVAGMVISLAHSAFAATTVDGSRLKVGGGASLAHVINEAVRAGLAGLEPLVGIPGTVGGAMHGNAGSRGGDVGQWAVEATVLTRSGEVAERKRDELVFAYRESSLDELAILDVTFDLESEDAEQLTKRMQKQWIVKKSGQPMTHQRTACLFKNPRGMSASMLIEQAGLAGLKVEGAELSSRHSNFVVVSDEATPAHVLKLIDQIRSRVAERLGVELETQLEIW
ncbi:UDP-N-acetylmuramate dehydrogenase [Aeoliella mucimassa]|uniref:UDP-N-acetylenolpyruvoylglucosamine reductase n=1 Tax=Aeoliella mucimassa TaxID=2527972 RepID=A0A518ALK7_9BACT|nr:UDP-N-acetylmuramate dehydrogenase [Aeoliella mucimassa]QDU55586.1 UDP-N-acetylenolpyruvoylglucosamine reductase MurB [Aeoliella mucimassa]